jgi:hypothetical protein
MRLYAYLTTIQEHKVYWDEVYWAEDEDHVREQVLNAYPEAVVERIEKLKTVEPIEGVKK